MSLRLEVPASRCPCALMSVQSTGCALMSHSEDTRCTSIYILYLLLLFIAVLQLFLWVPTQLRFPHYFLFNRNIETRNHFNNSAFQLFRFTQDYFGACPQHSRFRLHKILNLPRHILVTLSVTDIN